MNIINLNGELRPASGLTADDFYRPLRYGDAVFETIKVINSRPLLLERHLARLKNGMKLFRIYNEDIIDLGTCSKQINKLLRGNSFINARVRISVFRRGEGFYTPVTNSAGFMIEAHRSDDNSYVHNPPLRMGLFGEMKKHFSSLSLVKSSQSIIHVIAGAWALENNFDDCFIINTADNIAEAISSNVFALYGSHLLTPPLKDACLPGIMRGFIIESASETGLIISEKELNSQKLLEADEIFLSNMISGIKPVKSFLNRDYGSRLPAVLTEHLNRKLIP